MKRQTIQMPMLFYKVHIMMETGSSHSIIITTLVTKSFVQLEEKGTIYILIED